jgi:hypothetical protein
VSDVFVSYTRTDQDAVRALVEDIETLGHEPWFDSELTGGQAWWDEILSHIRGSDVFVFAVSRGSLASEACSREYQYAVDLGRTILPVLVADDAPIHLWPPALSRLQYVDYRERSPDVALRLARSFGEARPSRPPPDPLPEPPAVPVSYLGGLAERIANSEALTYEEQSALLLDLKRALQDPDLADDARELLGRFRQRDDLLANIASEIEEILDGVPGKPTGPELKQSRDALSRRWRLGSLAWRDVPGLLIVAGGLLFAVSNWTGQHSLVGWVQIAGTGVTLAWFGLLSVRREPRSQGPPLVAAATISGLWLAVVVTEPGLVQNLADAGSRLELLGLFAIAISLLAAVIGYARLRVKSARPGASNGANTESSRWLVVAASLLIVGAGAAIAAVSFADLSLEWWGIVGSLLVIFGLLVAWEGRRGRLDWIAGAAAASLLASTVAIDWIAPVGPPYSPAVALGRGSLDEPGAVAYWFYLTCCGLSLLGCASAYYMLRRHPAP